MSAPTILQAVLRRWYIVVPGILLSFIIASTVFSSMPPKYTSSGIAVLVRQNNPPPPNFVNPVLGGDGTLTTATLTLVQALDTPAVKTQLGLKEGVDNFTVNNVREATAATGADHPFLYIKAQSSDPQTSTDIVAGVMNIARQKLAEVQNDYHIRPQNQIKLQSVVDATPPKAVMNIVYAAGAAALIAGIAATCVIAYGWDRLVTIRQRGESSHSYLFDDNADPQSPGKTRKVSYCGVDSAKMRRRMGPKDWGSHWASTGLRNDAVMVIFMIQ